MKSLPLHWQILIALLLAALVGSVFSPETQLAGIGKQEGLGRLGGKTLLYYFFTSLAAILAGLLFVNLIAPGMVDGKPAQALLGLSDASDAVMHKVSGKDAGDIVDVFIRMVPTNIVSAAAEGQMLGLIFFSLLFGFFMTRTSQATSLFNIAQGVFDTMMQITLFIMKFAPLGVFALVGKVVLTTGFSAFQPLLTFFITVLVALAFHTLVTLPLLLKLAGGISPVRHYRAMSPALLTAFSTASSSATLPVTLECIEKNTGVSNRTSSFVLPLGATVNMDGTALYECVAAMFIAQAYGMDITLGTQFLIVTIALLTSIGVAGIPAASLVAITIILGAIGLPLEAIGLILVTDRILDMCRTAVNVLGDSCGAAIIASSEGEALLVK